MTTEKLRSQDLVELPSESLSVELKRWIDPELPEGIAKIARGALALRNFGGGYLIIGFDNNTFEPDSEHAPDDVRSVFHIDRIQGIVAHYASEPFEISIEFPVREGQRYPVVIVPPGVRTPVASKRDLVDDGKYLIRADTVYFRSLNSNNTPSTTMAKWKDWPNIVEVCFDNREADIGRFLRRHLTPAMVQGVASVFAGGAEPEVQEFPSTLVRGVEPAVTIEELLVRFLEAGHERFNQIIEERGVELPEHGSWEVALQLDGEIPEHSANRDFLNLLESSNPDYTGWPIWLDSRRFSDEGSRPYVSGGVWEAFIPNLGHGWNDHLDFMICDPKGCFFLYRALQDDISGSKRAPVPLTTLDFGLAIIRTAEAIAVGIAFAKAMGCKPEDTQLSFVFRWSRLKGRELSSWAQPSRTIFPGQHAYQDEVVAYVNVPLDVPSSALSEYVNQVIQPLFEVFDGFSLNKKVVEDLTRSLIERKL